MKSHSPLKAGVFYAVTSAVLMGTIGVFSKLMGIGAESISFLRLFLGACFMLLFLIYRGDKHLLRIRPSFSICINGAFLAGFIIFYVQAMNYTTMANAIMLVYLAPLVSSVYAHFFMNEKLKLSGLLLIILAVAGFAMMLEFKLDLQSDPQRAIGLGLGFIAMICYSCFILVNRTITADIRVSTFYQLLTGGLVMAPFYIYNFKPLSASQCILAIAVGFFPGFLAIYFAVTALRQLPAATFGTLAYFEPLAVVLFGWVIFQESLSPIQITGCAAIIASGCIKAASERR